MHSLYIVYTISKHRRYRLAKIQAACWVIKVFDGLPFWWFFVMGKLVGLFWWAGLMVYRDGLIKIKCFTEKPGLSKSTSLVSFLKALYYPLFSMIGLQTKIRKGGHIWIVSQNCSTLKTLIFLFQIPVFKEQQKHWHSKQNFMLTTAHPVATGCIPEVSKNEPLNILSCRTTMNSSWF